MVFRSQNIQPNAFCHWDRAHIIQPNAFWYLAIRLGNYEKIKGIEWFFKKYVLNFTQKLDLFGETLFFYPVGNTFSQTGCQIPFAIGIGPILGWSLPSVILGVLLLSIWNPIQPTLSRH